MVVKRTTDGTTTEFAKDDATYNGNLEGTHGNDELVVDNNSAVNYTTAADVYHAGIYSYNGSDTVTVASGGEVEGSIFSNNLDGLGDTISVSDGSTVLDSVSTGNGNDNITLAGQIGDGQNSDRISTSLGEDSLTIASTADVDVLQIIMESEAGGGSTLTIEDGAQISVRPSSSGAGIYTVHGDDTLYLGGTYTNYSGDDVDTYYGSDSITLGRDFSFKSQPGGDGQFLIMGRDDPTGGDTDTLHIGFLEGRIKSHVIDAANSENGTITLDDGSVIRYTGIEQVITCFVRGTKIVTAVGECAIEELCRNDSVLTLDNGLQPIRWIGSRKLSAEELEAQPNLRPIRVCAGALGRNTPESDLLVSPQHRVLVRSKIAQRMFGAMEVLVAAKHLLEIEGIEIATDVAEVEYFHMLFDRHEIVTSNGAKTESLYTGSEALKALGEAARTEIFTLFPELRDGAETGTAPIPARPLGNGRMGRKLSMRHARNNKPLLMAG